MVYNLYYEMSVYNDVCDNLRLYNGKMQVHMLINNNQQ